MSDQSAPVSSGTAWPALIHSASLKELMELGPGAKKVLLEQIAEDARFVRRMAWARLFAAIGLFLASLALSAFFVSAGAVTGAAVSAGSGSITVVTILLTGRPPSLIRRK